MQKAPKMLLSTQDPTVNDYAAEVGFQVDLHQMHRELDRQLNAVTEAPFPAKITVSVCDTQPIVSEGLQSLLSTSTKFSFLNALDTLDIALDHVLSEHPAILFIDYQFGISSILNFLQLASLQAELHVFNTNTIIWGAAVAEPDAVRFLKAGAYGVIRKTTRTQIILDCIDAVSTGKKWMGDSYLKPPPPVARLTYRERQILALIYAGLRNKQIAEQLNIKPGTVKVHVKHLFNKVGVSNRLGLAADQLARSLAPPD